MCYVRDRFRPRDPARHDRGRGSIAAASLILAACGSGPAALGPTIPAARANATDLFGALAARFGEVRRTPALIATRERYVRGALVPSRIYDDTTVFTSIEGSTRTISVAGSPTTSGYLLDLRPHAAPPEGVGHSRHVMHLRRLVGNEYVWDSADELAVGRVRPAEFSRALVRGLSGVEVGSEAGVRALYGGELPRTTGSLGRLFSLDSLRTTPLADGSTAVLLGIRLSPNRIRAEMPSFASYLDKYIAPAHYHIVLTDRGGAEWLDASAEKNLFMVRMRTRDGVLRPLVGGGRALPDTLVMRAELSAKVTFFTVGLSDLIGDFVFLAGPERGWEVRFHRDPEWHLPPVVGHLIRSSLRRPFAGDGVVVRFAVRDGPLGQAYLVRTVHIAVQESAIVRWLSNLGNKALSEVTAKVEEERDRFVGDAFAALQRDARAALGDATGAVAR